MSWPYTTGRSDGEDQPAAPLKDGFVIWPVLVGIIGIVLTGVLIAAGDPFIILMMAVFFLVVCGVAGAIALYEAVAALRRGWWRAALSYVFLPGLLLFALFHAPAIFSPFLWMGVVSQAVV